MVVTENDWPVVSVSLIFSFVVVVKNKKRSSAADEPIQATVSHPAID